MPAVLWVAYLFWTISLSGMSNLSLYTRSAVGRDPKELSGLILALRFGFKALSGLVLGVIAARFGIRAPLITTVCLLGLAAVWPLLAPGYTYLLAFGLMGAGGSLFPELRGGFLAPPAAVVVNLSLLNLVNPASSVGPVLHGALTEWHGLSESFTLGALAAVASLLLVFRLPSGPAPGSDNSRA